MKSSVSVSSSSRRLSTLAAATTCAEVERRQMLALAPGGLAADVIDHPPRRHLDQPAARVVGHSVARPLLRGREQRLLHRILRGGEVAVAADHGAEHLRREVAQELFGVVIEGRSAHGSSGGKPLITSRTSMGMFSGAPPGPGAADASAAIAYARAGFSTSTIQYPARNSFDSGKTPSVIGAPSLPARTSLA